MRKKPIRKEIVKAESKCENTKKNRLKKLLQDKSSVKKAFLLHEILKQP